MSVPLVSVHHLEKHFTARRKTIFGPTLTVRAVDGVDLQIERNELVALVGESGCGKSTLGKCVVRLLRPTAGVVRFDGVDVTALEGVELRRFRRRFQMIFQDPGASLDPKLSVGDQLREPLTVHRIVPARERQGEIIGLLRAVGLSAEDAHRFPSALSGGEQQRVGVARALAPRPELVVADEPLAALDGPARLGIVELLARLRRSRSLSLLLITHDLTVARRVADRVCVMYAGKIVETGPPVSVFGKPLHPYTAALVSAVPHPVPGRQGTRIVLSGGPPSPIERAAGCTFHPRCPVATKKCRTEEPAFEKSETGQYVACHHAGDLAVPGAVL